jgi:hypothetical protein
MNNISLNMKITALSVMKCNITLLVEDDKNIITIERLQTGKGEPFSKLSFQANKASMKCNQCVGVPDKPGSNWGACHLRLTWYSFDWPYKHRQDRLVVSLIGAIDYDTSMILHHHWTK